MAIQGRRAWFTVSLSWVLGRPGLEVEPRATSWPTRIQRVDNLWLQAVRLEHLEQYEDARASYLEDAREQETLGHFARAALSHEAAGNVAARMGATAFHYEDLQHAAELFVTHAESAGQWSLREVLWAYDHAASLYEALELPRSAADVRRRAAAVASHLFPPSSLSAEAKSLSAGAA